MIDLNQPIALIKQDVLDTRPSMKDIIDLICLEFEHKNRQSLIDWLWRYAQYCV